MKPGISTSKKHGIDGGDVELKLGIFANLVNFFKLKIWRAVIIQPSKTYLYVFFSSWFCLSCLTESFVEMVAKCTDGRNSDFYMPWARPTN